MDILKGYSIAHKGLGLGNHRFEFEVDDRFFEAFEGSEIHGGRASVTVDLNKQSAGLELHIAIEAEVSVPCDRCLEEFTMPLSYEGTLFVRYSETETESDGELMWIGPNETEVNLAQYIYESICLSLPYRRVHPDDENGESTCDKDMLSRFRIVSEEEFERIASEKAAESPWGRLEALKDKLEEKE